MKRTPPPPPPPGALAPHGLVAIRGPSGKIWGMLDPRTMVIQFKHGRLEEQIDLSVYRSERTRD